MCNKQLFFLQEVHSMNKNFLSLALVAAFSISFSVVAEEKKDDKKNEVKGYHIPTDALNVQDYLNQELDKANEALKEAQDNLDKLNKEKSKLEKDADPKEVNGKIADATKRVSDAKVAVDEYKEALNVYNNHIDAKYNNKLMNKLTVPARYVANLIANNKKVALALEVTGIAGLSYVIYKSFFAQEEEDEDSL